MDPQPIPVETNLISGQGSLEQAAQIADGRVFLVTDPGIVAAGHVAKLEAIFSAQGTTCHRFDAVLERDLGGWTPDAGLQESNSNDSLGRQFDQFNVATVGLNGWSNGLNDLSYSQM